MSYIGNTQNNTNYVPAVDFFSGNGSTTAFTLTRPVASYAAIQVTIANVAQNPTSAYTVSGNTITFTSAPPSGTNNIYVYYTSPILSTPTLAQSPSIIGPAYVSINSATPLGGATNPIVGTSGSANNYVQTYVRNATNGANSSADFTAYPSNGTDSSGWVDVGITGPTFSQAAFSVTGPNESYLFGSNPSGSSTTGNLVIATDSTGTTNNIQFYNGGFTKAKNAQSATISANGLGLGTAVASSGVGIAFPATQSASSDANTLDDYEEGTWTPSDGSGAGLTFTNVNGMYTKIGRMVYASFNVAYPATANTNQAVIAGFPFVTSGSVNNPGSGYLTYTDSNIVLTIPFGGGSSNGNIWTIGGGQVTNANLSGKAVRMTVIMYT